MGARKHTRTRTHTHTHKYKRQIQAPKQSRNFFIFSSLKFYGCSFCHSRVAQNEKCSYRIDLFTAKEDVSLF